MKRRFRQIVGDGPTLPLLVLFGLNAVDELDRAAFAILAPEIRDEFGLGFQGLLTLIAFVLAAALALQVPIAGLADRMNRVHLAILGAIAWAAFSFTTGLATSIVFLGFMRSGSAVGKAVVDPTHNSLLADYYPPERRPAVFSFHRAGNAVGQILGPLALATTDTGRRGPTSDSSPTSASSAGGPRRSDAAGHRPPAGPDGRLGLSGRDRCPCQKRPS